MDSFYNSMCTFNKLKYRFITEDALGTISTKA